MLIVFVMNPVVEGQISDLFVNANSGNDRSIGSKEQPLKTLNEAAERVNHANGKGAITIYLSEGIYGLEATVTFHPVNWHFFKDERLTISATVLPDDTGWNPGMMPVIVSTMPLDFKPNDLRITQCLFVGDKVAIPNHLAILASGQEIVVDHCVFYHCKDAIVFWYSDRPAEHCEVHHNLFIGNYGAAFWSWSAAEDLKFHNNVVENTNVFWILNRDEKASFSL
jgi:hypothetical protein